MNVDGDIIRSIHYFLATTLPDVSVGISATVPDKSD